jgi:NADH-quinone oxidoreductase subunit L
MFVAAGLGAYWVALFHLMAHAFFKALLFLGAGNVMHAMHDELDPFKMGDLKASMKWTWIFMTLASVALAGIYPLAGFFSKDLILEVSFVEHHYILYTVLLLTAGLTAFYSFRLVALIFHGDDRHSENGVHPHEAYNFMLYAMLPLAILAVVAGMIFKTPYFEMVTQVLPAIEYHIHNHTTFWIMTIGTQVFVIAAIVYAYKKYAKAVKVDKKVESGLLYQLLYNQYFIPQFYEEYFTKTYRELSAMMWKLDMKVVDATVDGVANIFYNTGKATHNMQDGNLSTMLRWMVIGTVILLVLAVAFTFGQSESVVDLLSGLGAI